MLEHFYAVIMAGGGGTRLWPLSRQTHPKQMLQLGGDRTLFQMAIDRIASLLPLDHILVVTVAEQAQQLKKQYPQLPEENFLLEPMQRGTASVVGLAAVVLRQRDPEAVMAVLTADHFIQNVESFHRLLQAAYDAAQLDYLVTLGIHPSYPATGYGYIQRGNEIKEVQGLPLFEVVKFKEKPAEEMARQFLARGDHYWNSGMFFWRVSTVLKEFERLMPELYATLTLIEKNWPTPKRNEVVSQNWVNIKPQTIDYGIMEKAQRVAVLPAVDLGWNDVGSWESVFEVLPVDTRGNIILGAQHLGIDTQGSLIYGFSDQRIIVTVGLNEMVVVDTENALLILPRKEAQKIRDVVNQLKEPGRQQYL